MTAKNEAALRNRVVEIMLDLVGGKRGGKAHQDILAIYNSRKPLPRGYALNTTDPYCAATVSAVWIKAGCDILGLVPIECSCGMMLQLAKGANIWKESDNYIPKIGDVVMYDWQDSGTGDNIGQPDHVGIIYYTNPDSGYFMVAEGNIYGGAIGVRMMNIGGQYIRGFITPDYAAIANEIESNNKVIPDATASIYQHPSYCFVTIMEIPRKDIERLDVAQCTEPVETLKSFYARQNIPPTIVTNGYFFDMRTGKNCFGLRNEGKEISEDWGYNGIGIIGDAELVYGKNDSNYRDWGAGYPVLVENGKACPITYAKEISDRAARTAIGYNNSTMFIVFVKSPGLSLVDLAELCAGLGCKYAINLDGGGSSQWLAKGVSAEKLSGRAVDSVVCVYLNRKAENALNPYVRPCPGTLLRKSNKHQPLVCWAQYRLHELGYQIDIDGYFGTQTEQAVKDFQKKNGLVVDGIIGDKTLGKLNK